MRLKLIDTNKGQMPTTIQSAINLSGLSRKEITEYLSQNEGGAITIDNNGFACKIIEKGWEHLYK